MVHGWIAEPVLELGSGQWLAPGVRSAKLAAVKLPPSRLFSVHVGTALAHEFEARLQLDGIYSLGVLKSLLVRVLPDIPHWLARFSLTVTSLQAPSSLDRHAAFCRSCHSAVTKNKGKNPITNTDIYTPISTNSTSEGSLDEVFAILRLIHLVDWCWLFGSRTF